jgi:hypothetical protein
MPKRARATHRLGDRLSRSDKCLSVKIGDDGHTLVCWRSPQHTESSDERRRQHYDPSAEKYWND